jgi:hypothetical protein
MAGEQGQRRAWLALAGYIAGADGMSAEEADVIGRSATTPELSVDESIALILAAGASTLPEDSLAAVQGVELGQKLDGLLEVAHAVATDGLSSGEWTRLREVAARLLGPDKVDALVRLLVADGEVRKARKELLA